MLSSTLNIRRLSTQFTKKLIYMIQSDRRMSEQKVIISSVTRKLKSIEEFGVSENSVDRYLQIDSDMEADEDNVKSHPSMRIPRQVLKAHYTRVFTEKSPSPYIVHLSKSCAEMLQLQLPDETASSEALRSSCIFEYCIVCMYVYVGIVVVLCILYIIFIIVLCNVW